MMEGESRCLCMRCGLRLLSILRLLLLRELLCLLKMYLCRLGKLERPLLLEGIFETLSPLIGLENFQNHLSYIVNVLIILVCYYLFRIKIWVFPVVLLFLLSDFSNKKYKKMCFNPIMNKIMRGFFSLNDRAFVFLRLREVFL